MALIKCPNCGREISDKSLSCIHCGYPTNAKNYCEDEIGSCQITNGKTGLKDFTKNKKFIISVVIFLVIVISSIFCFNNNLSSDEKYALNIVGDYQGMLKNPDSLILRSDISVIIYSRDGTTYKYVFFDASGDNSYGASVMSTPCFVNGRYLCDTDEIPSTSEYMDMSDDEAKKYLGLELAIAHWNLYGEKASEKEEDVLQSYSVDAKKIARKLDIKSKVNH